jgi:hypothetical protein
MRMRGIESCLATQEMSSETKDKEQQSANHKSLARLPLHLFEKLVIESPSSYSFPCSFFNENDDEGGEGKKHGNDSSSPMSSLITAPNVLKLWICSKLLHYDIFTVGQFLQQSPWSIVQMVSPDITLLECKELLQRISFWCAFNLNLPTNSIKNCNIGSNKKKKRRITSH